MNEYDERVRQQILQYEEDINIHALPDIFHYWSNEFILPGLKDVFGIDNVEDFYVNAFVAASSSSNASLPRFLSVGCGDGSIELGIALKLLDRGLSKFEFYCADLSPILLDRLRSRLDEQLRPLLLPIEQDLNAINIDGPFDAVMASHSLHHIVNLEALFSYVYDNLATNGMFVTGDMIGRNGHMRWPECAEFVNLFWPLLTERQRYNAQLQRVEQTFLDHDCSNEGFEGIRSQDILPLILATFHPEKFFGFGGFIDPFVDRGFGHGFNINDERDRALIKAIGAVNDVLLDGHRIKPTQMFAHFTKYKTAEKFFRTRSAGKSVRIP